MDGELTRVTVNLVPAAVVALNSACDRARESKTDAINRAVSLLPVIYELLERSDDRSLVVIQPDGRVERVYLL
ncbi:hypothetical protein KIF24_05460 [Micromonospora sp. Llam7]|uniref:hypothetical protein n=1 Tax=Micromonospora tarapacensis TaxID=2835305 RepID=UPI001C82AB62|nr:hypothetical protein [Micromonospora tarapacensis]MBX7265545.1 hypothetical protein [Micromonospora tarapacensis]